MSKVVYIEIRNKIVYGRIFGSSFNNAHKRRCDR